MKYLKNVATLKLNTEKCISCRKCIDVCPQEVLQLTNEKKVIIKDLDRCIECGACQKNCPIKEAITVRAGVGCAAAYITSGFTGKSPTCGNSDDGPSCC